LVAEPPRRVGRSALAQPSKFWQALGTEHAADLDSYGIDAIKRHQALRYFTWSWRWRALHRSRQLRFLLRRTSPVTLLRCAVARTDLSDAAWSGLRWSRGDRWLYAFAVRVLWEYAARNDPLGVLGLPEPRAGQPLPVRWRNRLISQDLANSALEAGAIARALAGRRPRVIVEVGAGYGRLAYALLNAYPDAQYAIVDIEPALKIARWYLGELFPTGRIAFIHPDEVENGAPSADLVLSVSSLQEMTRHQVAGYFSLFDRIGRGGVVYLKQRSEWPNPDDGITLPFGEYPIPADWRTLFDDTAPVQSDFRHAAWSVPPVS
jgi:putative sugar O-methyltransferase